VVATGVDFGVASAARPAAAAQPAPPVQPRIAAAPPSPPPRQQAQIAQPPASVPHSAIEAKSVEHHESRIAELAQRLKADNARIAERIERAEQQAHRPPAQQPIPQPVPVAASAPPPQAPPLRASIDQAAAAAVAAALAPRGEEITIRPMAQKPSLFAEPTDREPLQPVAEPAAPKVFIPPQPERPMNRSAPRMPTFEELPVPGQNEFRVRRGEPTETEHPEKRRLTLLQRLAAVGLGRREDEAEPEARVEPARAPVPERAPPRAAARPPESRGPEPVSEYGKRGAPQGLDIHGRATPVHAAPDDDQLDIPAFLRRQAT
jgi:cell division protein FtsZ